MLSRRSLLVSAAPAVFAAAALGGCSNQFGTIALGPSGITVSLSTAVIDAIQTDVAAAAKYVPTAESIAAEAASLFGPAATTLVTVGSTYLNEIIAALEALVQSPSVTVPIAAVPASARLFAARFHRMGAGLRAAAPAQSAGQVLVGYSKSGIAVYAYAA